MITKTKFYLLSSLAVLLASALPAAAVSREIVQLQTQVQTLQDQVARLQQSFDAQMAIMKNLVEQSTDAVNKMGTTVNALQTSVQQQSTASGAKVDQVSQQIQALHDSLDELKARVAQLSKQLSDMQAAQQNLNAQPAQPVQPQQPQAPPADVLYNNALRDYNSGNYQLAGQEFGDYLKFYSNTDLAGNAQFYIAEIEYRQGNYDQAVKDYDTVLEQYPGGNKTASAQLKKGFALLALNQRAAGERELKSVIARYPRSIEASEARDRLKRMSPQTGRRATAPQ